jgi:hypothetical protein
MKKVFAILAGAILITLLAACSLTDMFKGKPADQQSTQNPPPPPPPPVDNPPPPPDPPPPPPPVEPPASTQHSHGNTSSGNQSTSGSSSQGNTNQPPDSGNQGSTQNGYDQGTTVPPPKVKKAGLGIIFTGNLEQGQFRVKTDNELVYELAFAGKDTRATKELALEPGSHLMKFVVIDAKGVRGVKEETMNFTSGRHQTVRVSVKDTPGAIIVEHLE